MTTIAATLAQMVTRTTDDELPPLALDHAAMMISSTIASAAAGYNITSSRVIRELAQEQGGTAESSIWFDNGAKLPAINACRVNAVMSDAAASDDSDLRNIVHLGTQLTSTTLALGERLNASGKDVLAAMVLGYEVAGRIAESAMPGYRDLGFHGSVLASFGAAVASGCMLKLNPQQMAQTIALVAVSMGGLATAADTSEAREYFAGNAALAGMNAALAAQKGYIGEERILETKKGFLEVFGAEDIDGITRDWGKSWDIVTDMAIKLVPGGHPYHAFGEAAANAAREGNIAPDAIAAIVLSRPGLTQLSGPLHPKDLIGMAHSPAYFAAAGARDKRFGWEHASPEKISDPIIHALIDKVRVGAPPAATAAVYRQGATVTIETTAGRTVANTVLVPKGAACLGLEWAEIEAKYRALAPNAPMPTGKVEASLATIRELRTAPSVTALIERLA